MTSFIHSLVAKKRSPTLHRGACTRHTQWNCHFCNTWSTSPTPPSALLRFCWEYGSDTGQGAPDPCPWRVLLERESCCAEGASQVLAGGKERAVRQPPHFSLLPSMERLNEVWLLEENCSCLQCTFTLCFLSMKSHGYVSHHCPAPCPGANYPWRTRASLSRFRIYSGCCLVCQSAALPRSSSNTSIRRASQEWGFLMTPFKAQGLSCSGWTVWTQKWAS